MVSTVAWLVLLWTTSFTRALTSFEVLNVLKNFADNFMAPYNVQVAKSINSTLFAEDVFGTIDVSTNFDGRELATEYIFGLFVNIGEETKAPSILGIPRSYNVTNALVQHNTVSASVIIQFEYPVLNKTFPIEIAAYMNINEQKQIAEYDLTFRRFAWATDVIVPQLIPFMRERINSTSANDSQVLHEYISGVICQASLASCNGTNEHYESMDDCMDFLAGRPTGSWYRMGEDNLSCRYLHTQMLHLRPDVHCPHVGRTGGMFCVPRDYTEVVLESHFPQGFLAPKLVTPENRKAVQNLYVTNGTDLNPLLEISLDAADLHSWSPSLFATCTFVFLLILFASAKITFFLFEHYNRTFKLVRHEIQINIVMYALNIFYTTVALALELAAAPVLAGDYDVWMVKLLRISGVIICGLYCFELIYRHDLRIQLILHHILTIFAVSFTATVFEYTQNMSYMYSAIIWLFQATTEQSVFVGLMGYRLRWPPLMTARILEWSAWQTLIVKTASAIALIVWWGIDQNYTYRPIDQAWSAMVWIIGVGLLATQFWGSHAVFAIGRRVEHGNMSALGTPEHHHLPLPMRHSLDKASHSRRFGPVPTPSSDSDQALPAGAVPPAHHRENSNPSSYDGAPMVEVRRRSSPLGMVMSTSSSQSQLPPGAGGLEHSSSHMLPPPPAISRIELPQLRDESR